MWKVWDMNHRLGHTLFSLGKIYCNRNGSNDVLDYISIHMTRIHFSLLSTFIVMLKVIHLLVMHCHIMKVVKMQWKILSCLQQFVTTIFCWYTLYNPVRTRFISTEHRDTPQPWQEGYVFLFSLSDCCSKPLAVWSR